VCLVPRQGWDLNGDTSYVLATNRRSEVSSTPESRHILALRHETDGDQGVL
jgi:hypothetical protein